MQRPGSVQLEIEFQPKSQGMYELGNVLFKAYKRSRNLH